MTLTQTPTASATRTETRTATTTVTPSRTSTATTSLTPTGTMTSTQGDIHVTYTGANETFQTLYEVGLTDCEWSYHIINTYHNARQVHVRMPTQTHSPAPYKALPLSQSTPPFSLTAPSPSLLLTAAMGIIFEGCMLGYPPLTLGDPSG